MKQGCHAACEQVEADLPFFGRQPDAFCFLLRTLFRLFPIRQVLGRLVAASNRRQRNRLIRRRKDRHPPRKADKVAVRFEDAPKERVVGIDLDPLASPPA